MSALDWLGDDEWYREYAAHFLKQVLPALDDSEFSVSIIPGKRNENSLGDVKYWTELGASIMLDKPIIALVEPGAEIPGKLSLVADIVIEVDLTTEEGRQRSSDLIAVAIEKIAEERNL